MADEQIRCWCGEVATTEILEGMVGDTPLVILVCEEHGNG